MIDLHCHLLPGVDDGSRSVEQSVTVLREMARHGITDVCLTPHLTASRLNHGVPATFDQALAALRAVAPESPRLLRAAEVMLDCPLSREVGDERRATLGGSRYILVEFPRLVPAEVVERALRDVVRVELIPLLAHPERYRCGTTANVRKWRELGARMQVDATTLASPRKRGQRARDIVAAGLADIAAADNHGDGRLLSTVRELLESRHGAEQADRLTRGNPARILADEELEPVGPVTWHTSWWRRFKLALERDDL